MTEKPEITLKDKQLQCSYPDWQGGYEIGTHNFGKDGYCIICGYKEGQG